MKETGSYRDLTLNCKDCGVAFTWTAGEQEFYFEKGFDPPKRCPECRAYLKRKMHAHRRREVRNGRQ